jgi:phage repressor protein C with HTH and peptisase S24 domain
MSSGIISAHFEGSDSMNIQKTLSEMLAKMAGPKASYDTDVFVVTTNHWEPYFRDGDTLLLHRTENLNAGDLVRVTTKNDVVFLGVLQERANGGVIIKNLTSKGRLSIFDESQMIDTWKVISVMKR